MFILDVWRDVHMCIPIGAYNSAYAKPNFVHLGPVCTLRFPTRRSDMVVDVPTVDRVRPSVCVPARRAACILPVVEDEVPEVKTSFAH